MVDEFTRTVLPILHAGEDLGWHLREPDEEGDTALTVHEVRYTTAFTDLR